MIDNAAHTARLSEPIAGFGSLKWVFLFIWKILCEVERIIEEKQKKELQIEDITKEIKD